MDNGESSYRRFLSGDEAAFDELLNQYRLSLIFFINRIVHDPDTAEGLQKTLDSAAEVQVQASLPQFSYDYDLELNDVLIGMGMPTAFDGGLADFSPMATSENGNIFIGSVLHKTHITVDTQGTRAAAVTKVDMAADGMLSEYRVTLNRPFVYLILDAETNLPLFIGTVLSISN